VIAAASMSSSPPDLARRDLKRARGGHNAKSSRGERVRKEDEQLRTRMKEARKFRTSTKGAQGGRNLS